ATAAAFSATPIAVFIPPAARVAAVAAAGAASAVAGLPAALGAHLTRLDSGRREQAVYFQSALGGVFSAARASAADLTPARVNRVPAAAAPDTAKAAAPKPQAWTGGNVPEGRYSALPGASLGAEKFALPRRTFLFVADEVPDRTAPAAWSVALVARDQEGTEVARLEPDRAASEALSASRWAPEPKAGRTVWRGAQRYVFQASDPDFEAALRRGVSVWAELDRGRGPESYPLPPSLE
ncbi:MAG TPA: hypothetical protein VHN99_00855, partial [Deinococcales bacterium]|nr:hypothetical protein [Deinococcales bacterium]